MRKAENSNKDVYTVQIMLMIMRQRIKTCLYCSPVPVILLQGCLLYYKTLFFMWLIKGSKICGEWDNLACFFFICILTRLFLLGRWWWQGRTMQVLKKLASGPFEEKEHVCVRRKGHCKLMQSYSDHFYPIMKHLYRDGSGVFQDVNHILCPSCHKIST